MINVDAIYRELDEANRAVDLLRARDSSSLDTPEKRFEHDVSYQKAMNRLIAAEQQKFKAVYLASAATS